MSYLVDTCVLSEFTKANPNSSVLKWLNGQNEEDLYLSSVVLGEISRGVARLPESSKKRKLDAWLHTDLIHRFQGRVLAVDAAIALEWGRLSAQASLQGKALSMADGLIAATAAQYAMVLVTRNIKDFEGAGISLFNPWDDV